jgi:hypothetical protein
MSYCHCNSCRSWLAAPVNAFTLRKPENVTVKRDMVFDHPDCKILLFGIATHILEWWTALDGLSP